GRDDVRQMVVGDGRRGCALETRLLAEDGAVEPLQRRARLDAELVDECAPGVEIRLERLGLAARAVERQHQLAAQPFAERVLPDEGLELAGEIQTGRLLVCGCD